MYSYKQRNKSVEISQQTRSLGKTLQIPGYPSSKKLYKRIHEHQQNGELYKKRVKPERIYYNEEEKATAPPASETCPFGGECRRHTPCETVRKCSPPLSETAYRGWYWRKRKM